MFSSNYSDSITRAVPRTSNSATIPPMTCHMNNLANTSVDDMPTCVVAVIGFEIASWTELYSAGGELLDYDFPKKGT